MRDQEQDRTTDESGDTPEFSIPDCCGPLMERLGAVDTEEATSARWSTCAEIMGKMTAGEGPMKSCPMSAMFKRNSGRRGFGHLVMIPGMMLVLVGAAIILEPQILIWLMAAAAIFAGLMLVAAATFFRKVAAGLARSRQVSNRDQNSVQRRPRDRTLESVSGAVNAQSFLDHDAMRKREVRTRSHSVALTA
jgi:hypothetical protein